MQCVCGSVILIMYWILKPNAVNELLNKAAGAYREIPHWNLLLPVFKSPKYSAVFTLMQTVLMSILNHSNIIHLLLTYIFVPLNYADFPKTTMIFLVLLCLFHIIILPVPTVVHLFGSIRRRLCG